MAPSPDSPSALPRKSEPPARTVGQTVIRRPAGVSPFTACVAGAATQLETCGLGIRPDSLPLNYAKTLEARVFSLASVKHERGENSRKYARIETVNQRDTTRPGMEFRLQAAGRGSAWLSGEFSTCPTMPPPCQLKLELHTWMRMTSPEQNNWAFCPSRFIGTEKDPPNVLALLRNSAAMRPKRSRSRHLCPTASAWFPGISGKHISYPITPGAIEDGFTFAVLKRGVQAKS